MNTCRRRHVGRYLWDNYSLEEIQAQFDMQKRIPISPEYWIYIILDINIHLRAGENLSIETFREYVERTGTVLSGWYEAIPELECLSSPLSQICRDIAKMNIKCWTLETRVELSIALLNLLHYVTRFFEVHTNLIRHRWEDLRYERILAADIDLDSLQWTCGRCHGKDSIFTSTEWLREYVDSFTVLNAQMIRYTAVNAEFLEFIAYLSEEHWGVLKSAKKYLDRMKTHPEPPSKRDWLIERLELVIRLTRLFSGRCENQLKVKHLTLKLWGKLDEGESEMQDVFSVLTAAGEGISSNL
jgi:hypothetical protein